MTLDIQYTEPPEPPAGDAWCVVCLMLAKGAQQDAARVLIGQLKANGKDEGRRRHWIAWDHGAELRPARYRAISEIAQLGIVDTCWHHMAGIGERPASALLAGGTIPPGLLKGRG